MDVTVKGMLNNTRDEVAGWLGEAREICLTEYDNAEVPDAVLTKVLELLANKTILTMAPQPMPVDLGNLRNGPLGGQRR
jgi:hypothetical protein